MKPKILFVGACLVIFVLFFIASISFGGELWPKKQGELCWDVYQDQPGTPDGFLRLFALKTGANNYLVNGSNTEESQLPGGEDSVTLVVGNAIVRDAEILIHTSASAYDEANDEVRGWLGTVKIDRSTLNGYFAGVGINYDTTMSTGGGSIKFDGEQSLIYTHCP